tara:strand:- start:482 stop:1855 length:1374 start_codon:yes stop_codon:yes gene_type:complete
MAVNRSLMQRQLYQQGGGAIYPRMDGLSSSISQAEQQLQQINQSIDQVQSNLGSGGDQGIVGGGRPIGGGSTGGNPFDPRFTDDFGSGGGMPRPMVPPEQGGLMSGFADFSKKTYGDGPFVSTADTRSYTLPDGTTGSGSSTSIGRINAYLESIGSPGLTFNNNLSGAGPLQTQSGGGMLGAYRNMAANGGAMNIVPREQYGLGSFIKKAVKGVTGAVKKVAKSPLGLAALGLGVNAFGLPFGGAGKGFLSNMFSGGFPGFSTAKNFLGGEKTLGKTLGVMAGGSLLGGLLTQAEQTGDVDGITRNVGALRSKLINAYKNQKTFVNEADEDAAIAAQVEVDLSEYNQDMARGMANGGRIGYALGSPEQNAIQAAGIMNLPLNQNPAGVTELDLRETGGFIPPVGVKEKADDIPAMLANNEFVMTADAVREFGDGNVNKGAQRMYDMMKQLEKNGRKA